MRNGVAGEGEGRGRALVAVLVAGALGLTAVVTAMPGTADAGTFPGKNGLIAFHASDGNDDEIYTIPKGGGEPTQITDNSRDDFSPS